MSTITGVSVVVGAYNAEAFIEQAVTTALGQTCPPLEVIVVDDASTDGTWERLRLLAEADSRVIVRRHAINTGAPAATRNTALALARGEFVAFLDADDWWHPHKLSDQIAVMRREPDLVFVYSVLDAVGDLPWLSVARGLKPLPHRAAVTLDDLRHENTIGCSSVMVRASSLRGVGVFDPAPELIAVEDYDLWLRLASSGPFGFIPRVHGYYRQHRDGISKRARMSDRLSALSRKHQLPPDQQRDTDRSVWFSVARLAGHVAAKTMIDVCALVERGLGRPVPVRRTTAEAP